VELYNIEVYVQTVQASKSNINIIKNLFFMLSSCLCSYTCLAVSLNDAMLLVVQKSAELKLTKKRHDMVKSRADAVDGAFDPKLTGLFSYSYDHSKSRYSYMDKLKLYTISSAYEKLLSFGASYKLGIENTYSDTDYQLGSSIGGNPVIANHDNPLYDTKIKLEYLHFLGRNRFAQEIKMKKELILSESSSFSLEEKLSIQRLKNKIEKLFFQYSFLHKQIELIKKVKKISHKLLLDFERLQDIGRVESIRVFEAEERYALAQKRVLEFELQLEKVKLKIINMLYTDKEKKIDIDLVDLKKLIGGFFWEDMSAAFFYAKKHRYDLLNFNVLEKVSIQEISLEDEKNKPYLNLFLSLESAYYDKKYIDSVANMSKFERPKFSVGLKLDFPLGDAGYRNNKKNILQKISSYKDQKQVILDSVEKDLNLYFFTLNFSKKIKNNILLRVKTLKNKKKHLDEKFTQARIDRILLLQNQLSLLETEIDKLKSDFDERITEANIKLLCHAYSL
jgi:hypothetical protein